MRPLQDHHKSRQNVPGQRVLGQPVHRQHSQGNTLYHPLRAWFFKPDQKGLTLVEIMVAMIILAIALAWLAPLLVLAMRGNRFGGDLTVASTLAQDKIEELRNVSYSGLLANPAGQDTLGKMVRSWTITEEPGQDGLARIEIIVSWQDDKGKAHQAQFATLQARAM
jgi:prepilin-type N-terminal cleavage/methylation domain-containing protein